MGTRIRVLSKSYPTNTNMTGFRWFSQHLGNTNWCKVSKKWLKPCHMGTHLTVLSKSYPMNTNNTWLGWFSKKSLHFCALDESSLRIGRDKRSQGADSHWLKSTCLVCFAWRWSLRVSLAFRVGCFWGRRSPRKLSCKLSPNEGLERLNRYRPPRKNKQHGQRKEGGKRR